MSSRANMPRPLSPACLTSSSTNIPPAPFFSIRSLGSSCMELYRPMAPEKSSFVGMGRSVLKTSLQRRFDQSSKSVLLSRGSPLLGFDPKRSLPVEDSYSAVAAADGPEDGPSSPLFPSSSSSELELVSPSSSAGRSIASNCGGSSFSPTHSPAVPAHCAPGGPCGSVSFDSMGRAVKTTVAAVTASGMRVARRHLGRTIANGSR
mmetsp:Transcript_9489/g.20471  ORF Transcript_9489/g.20471 Transcript_9489/m.20471 type:complete len:205 (-) Transcript_9489:48-662(-)